MLTLNTVYFAAQCTISESSFASRSFFQARGLNVAAMTLRIAYAGDRDIGVRVLDHLLERGVHPLALLVSEASRATHAEDLTRRCTTLNRQTILHGVHFRTPEGISFLQALDLDVLVCVHFPYLVPSEVLRIPRLGVLNLHPAYLPYNRGWHTPSWALLEGTPIGATLHFMDEGIDTGDIVFQKQLQPSPGDTANSLYQKLKTLELEVFKEGWALIEENHYERLIQDKNQGTTHKRRELLTPEVQRIDLNTPVPPIDLFRRLRALTTNNTSEAAYYEVAGKRYRIQVNITEDSSTEL